MLEINKKLKRILCILIVCIMITPMVSFATNDEADSTDSAETTENAGEAGGETTETPAGSEETAPDSGDDKLTPEQLAAKRAEEKARAQESAVMDADEIDKAYTKVASTSKLELYVNTDTLHIIIRDIATGAVFCSFPQDFDTDDVFASSPVTINYASKNKGGSWIEVKPENRYSALAEGVNHPVTIKENGFTVHLEFTKQKLEFDYTVTLDEETGLQLHVPLKDTLKEGDPDNFRLSIVYLYPFLGATKLDYRDASLFLPDGSGIICNLRNFEEKYGNTMYIMQYYGTDIGKMVQNTAAEDSQLGGRRISFRKAGEEATMPVFGMIHNDTKMAMLGVIESGAENATCMYTLNSYANWNLISARYHVRDTYQYPTSQSGNQSVLRLMPNIEIDNIDVTYLFTTGEDADYAGLAVKYRELLQKDGTLVKKDTTPKVRVDLLGVDKENFLVFKRNVVMTTTEDAANIFDDMNDRGVNSVLAIYKGWQDGGVYALPTVDFDADGDIGGKSGLKDLATRYGSKGITLALEHDAQTINPDLSGERILEKVNQREYEDAQVSDVFDMFNLAYPDSSREMAVAFAKEVVSDGIPNVAVKGLASETFSYADGDTIYSRKDTVSTYTQTLQDMKLQGATLLLNQPNAYAWKYADAYTDLVMGSSSYVYADQEVPFMSIVLKGSIPMYSEYVNFEAEKTKFFLQLIDQGVYPSFLITQKDPSYLENTNSNYIYSSSYDLYKEEIQEYYAAVKEVAEKTGDAYIVDHEELESGVNVTTYDNGTKVYTNYTEEKVVVDGFTIDALSYEVR